MASGAAAVKGGRMYVEIGGRRVALSPERVNANREKDRPSGSDRGKPRPEK